MTRFSQKCDSRFYGCIDKFCLIEHIFLFSNIMHMQYGYVSIIYITFNNKNPDVVPYMNHLTNAAFYLKCELFESMIKKISLYIYSTNQIYFIMNKSSWYLTNYMIKYLKFSCYCYLVFKVYTLTQKEALSTRQNLTIMFVNIVANFQILIG